MKIVLAGLVLVGLAACGQVHPDRGSAASAVPATQGGGTGPLEGSPGNATNVGSPGSTTLQK